MFLSSLLYFSQYILENCIILLHTIVQINRNHLVSKMMNLFLVGSDFHILGLQSSQLFVQLHTFTSGSISNTLFQIGNGSTITSLLFMHIVGTNTGNDCLADSGAYKSELLLKPFFLPLSNNQ